MEFYDICVIGAGPAGLTAAIYAGRYNLKTIVLGRVFGGTISMAHEVGNWPGTEKISGADLANNMINHVKSLGIEVLPKRVEQVTKVDDMFVIACEGFTVNAKKVILACGTKRRQLNVAREEEFTGNGLSYCNTCDGIYFKDRVVGVVGGGNAGCSSANELAGVAKQVHIICPESSFIFAEPIRSKLIEDNSNIVKHFNATVVELIGDDRLKGVKLSDGTVISLAGLFVEIGAEPDKVFLTKIGLPINKNGYVVADSKMKTSIPGLFSAGSVNHNNFDQAISAAFQGALAANTAYKELKGDKK